MKILIKQETISRNHIQTTYKWQENSKTENRVELLGMSKARIWISGEEEVTSGIRRAGLGKSK